MAAITYHFQVSEILLDDNGNTVHTFKHPQPHAEQIMDFIKTEFNHANMTQCFDESIRDIIDDCRIAHAGHWLGYCEFTVRISAKPGKYWSDCRHHQAVNDLTAQLASGWGACISNQPIPNIDAHYRIKFHVNRKEVTPMVKKLYTDHMFEYDTSDAMNRHSDALKRMYSDGTIVSYGMRDEKYQIKFRIPHTAASGTTADMDIIDTLTDAQLWMAHEKLLHQITVAEARAYANIFNTLDGTAYMFHDADFEALAKKYCEDVNSELSHDAGWESIITDYIMDHLDTLDKEPHCD